VWKLDMFNQLGVWPHEQSPCSPAADGTRLFVVTSNGVDQSHVKIPAPDAPSFVALDKRTGRVLWTDHSPGRNIMHSQWGSPLYAVLGGVPQVIFPGGDGWIYSFDPAGTPQGTSKLLWKFDINPKRSVFAMGGRRDRNEQSFSLTAYEDRVYCACGQDPEHGEGPGHIWCIDPTKRGDVSAELVVDPAQPKRPLPPERLAAPAGGIIIANPNSAVVWHYDRFDLNGDGVITPDETMHRSRSGVAIQDGFLFAADFSGYVHCLDAGSGRLFWTYDLFAACWCTPLIADHHAYACDEEGKVSIFRFPSRQPGTSSLPPLVAEIDMGNTIYAAPTAAAGVLYIATRNRLYAIAAGAGLIVP
jgi:outer membrane protein assembly factor BamB